MTRTVAALAVLALGLAVAAPRAGAEEPPAPPRPWAEGVPPDRQAEALRLFDEGNHEFEELHHAQALAIYRRAVAVWDHPAIRYNMAVSLINLDQPLAAYEDLERALAYGSAALFPKQYQEALTYRKLLLAQLARLTVRCAEPGAVVLLDGQILLTGPAEVTRVLAPGPHQLVASKDGFQTATRALALIPGQAVDEDLRPAPPPRPVRTIRRFAPRTPWVVVGAGATLTLAYLPLRLAADAAFDDYDAGVSASCPQGCRSADLPAPVRDTRRRAELESGLAVGLLTAGVAVAVTGLVLVVLNQPRVVPDDVPPPAPRLTLAPALAPRHAGLELTWRF